MRFVLSTAFALKLAILFQANTATAQDFPLGGAETVALSCSPVGEPILGAKYVIEHDVKPSIPLAKSSVALRVITTVVAPGARPRVHNLEQTYQDRNSAVYETGEFKVVISKVTNTAYLSLNLEPIQKCKRAQSRQPRTSR